MNSSSHSIKMSHFTMCEAYHYKKSENNALTKFSSKH